MLQKSQTVHLRVLLLPHNSFDAFHAGVHNILLPPHHFASKELPANSTRRHVKPQVFWIIDELENGVRRVVAWSVAKFMNSRVTSFSPGISVGKHSKQFRDKCGFEEEALRLTCSWEATFLSKGNDLD